MDDRAMKVLITGASGFVGTALTPELTSAGHEVRRLVRRETRSADEDRWDPDRRSLDPAVLSDVDAVIHLAGAGIADRRWTSAYKRQLLDSRVDGTTTIAKALATASQADGRPRALLSASAVGWYGDTGDTIVDESAPVGAGFLADLVRQWEAATEPATAAGVRVVRMRTGLLCGRSGGLMGRLLPLFRLGAGGPMGSGRQYWPWITMPDHLAAVGFLLTSEAISGPVNLTGPVPVTNAEFAAALGKAVRRPALIPAPSPALRLALGEFAGEGVLIGQRAVPVALTDHGFEFTHPDIESAMNWVAGGH